MYTYENFSTYIKKIRNPFENSTTYRIIRGFRGTKEGYIYKCLSFNKIDDIETKIPFGYKKEKLNVSEGWFKEYIYNPKIKQLNKDNEYSKIINTQNKDAEKYFTYYNGGNPFLVYEHTNEIRIYKESNEFYISDAEDGETWPYIHHVATYRNPKGIFIGRTPIHKRQKYNSTINYEEFDGNTILLNIDNNKYIYISEAICEFITNDTILEYYSPIMNGDVPLPYAIGKKNIYLLREMIYIPYNDKYKMDPYKQLCDNKIPQDVIKPIKYTLK